MVVRTGIEGQVHGCEGSGASNQFHLLLLVPKAPETPLTDEELLSRIEALSCSPGSKTTANNWSCSANGNSTKLLKRYANASWCACGSAKAEWRSTLITLWVITVSPQNLAYSSMNFSN